LRKRRLLRIVESDLHRWSLKGFMWLCRRRRLPTVGGPHLKCSPQNPGFTFEAALGEGGMIAMSILLRLAPQGGREFMPWTHEDFPVIAVRRDAMTERERRSLRPTANWQVWSIVFVVLVLIMTVWLLLS
jgi:hypothetical protein